MFGSVATSKFTVRRISPLLALVDVHVIHVIDATHPLLDRRGH